jgi:hypothetical protein
MGSEHGLFMLALLGYGAVSAGRETRYIGNPDTLVLLGAIRLQASGRRGIVGDCPRRTSAPGDAVRCVRRQGPGPRLVGRCGSVSAHLPPYRLKLTRPQPTAE